MKPKCPKANWLKEEFHYERRLHDEEKMNFAMWYTILHIF